MLKRIEALQDGKKTEEIVELNLDNCESDGTIEGLDDGFSSLQNLSLVNAGITSLKGFPKLLKLQKLELSGNSIEGGLSSLSGCVSLQHINLSGNNIIDMDVLSPLSDLKNLTSLDLVDCGVTELSNFRENIFKLLPTLKFLNGSEMAEKGDHNGKEATEKVPQVQVIDEDDGENESSSSEASVGESDEESGVEGVGLSYLERDDISDDEDDGDYEEDSEGVDEEIEDDSEDDHDEARGVKRKLEEEEDES